MTTALVIESVAPDDLANALDRKVLSHLESGAHFVYVVYPKVRRVRVYRRDRSGVTLQENDELSGENVLPGFRCRVGDLFLPPPGVQA